jgi:RND superfamily putative drug exporter
VLVAPSVSGVLKSGIQVNSSAYTANQQIAKQYGGTTANPGIVVIDLPAGTTVTSAGVPAQLQALDTQVARAVPGMREISYASTGNRSLVSNGGRSTIVMVFSPKANTDVPPQVLDQLAGAAKSALPTATVHATGKTALAASNASSGNSSVLTELLIGALAALVVLAWVFGSFLAFLPLIMAIVSVLTMQLLIYGPHTQPGWVMRIPLTQPVTDRSSGGSRRGVDPLLRTR